MTRNFVYFMRNPENGEIKIGQSIHPDQRRKEVRRDVGARRLDIMATIEDEPLESILHRHFATHRLHGEWFYPAPEVVRFVENHKGRADRVTLEQKLGEMRDTMADEDYDDVPLVGIAILIALIIVVLFGALTIELLTNAADKFVAMVSNLTVLTVKQFMFSLFWIAMEVIAPLVIKMILVLEHKEARND